MKLKDKNLQTKKVESELDIPEYFPPTINYSTVYKSQIESDKKQIVPSLDDLQKKVNESLQESQRILAAPIRNEKNETNKGMLSDFHKYLTNMEKTTERKIIAVFVVWTFLQLVFLALGWKGHDHEVFWPFSKETNDDNTITHAYDFSEFILYAGSPWVAALIYRILYKYTQK